MKTSKSIRMTLWIFSLLVCLTAFPAYGETYYCTAKSGLNCRWEPNRRQSMVLSGLPKPDPSHG